MTIKKRTELLTTINIKKKVIQSDLKHHVDDRQCHLLSNNKNPTDSDVAVASRLILPKTLRSVNSNSLLKKFEKRSEIKKSDMGKNRKIASKLR